MISRDASKMIEYDDLSDDNKLIQKLRKIPTLSNFQLEYADQDRFPFRPPTQMASQLPQGIKDPDLAVPRKKYLT